MKSRVECNNCCITSCRRYKTVSKACVSFMPFDNFKLPILFHLFVDEKRDALIETLKKVKLGLKEINSPPYFMLTDES